MIIMAVITAKQLKQRTGEIIKRIKAGEKLTVTFRGKLSPASEEQKEWTEKLRSFEEAWKGIETTLSKTKPQFKDWKEAMAWVRKRTSF